MRLLLDTRVVIWWVEDPDNLSSKVDAILLDPATSIFVSPVSAWEIAYKHRAGRLNFPSAFLKDFDKRIGDLGWRCLPLEFSHAVAGAQLPGKHKDPFDRMLAGQAAVEKLTVVTRDAKLKRMGVDTIW